MSIEYRKKFFDNVLDSIIEIGKDGKIKEVNQATLKLLGYKRKEDLMKLPMKKICKGFSLRGLRHKIPLRERELIYRDKGRKQIPVSVNIICRTPASDDIVFMARDIRKAKKLINELTASREEFRSSYAELQSSKDELVHSEKLAYTGRIAANIAHEIRNPLTNVSMSVQQLRKAIKPEDPRVKHIEIIERNTERVNYLIAELLNCARPPKLNIRPYNIHKLLRSVLDLSKTKIKSQRIKVVKRFTSRPSVVNMDKEHIGRAFLNIVINAIEAMPKSGKLTIVTEIDRGFFVAKIRDTGKGIPQKDVIRIFDPFFSSKADGVGLGLTVCYGIIVSHGGTIAVESKPKKGSEFTISLPLAERESLR